MNIFFSELCSAYWSFWQNLTDFNGETIRKDWWYVQLVNFIINLITLPFFIAIKEFNIQGFICILPQIAINLRILNNFGKDWKWIFINYIPLIGWLIWFIWLGLEKKEEEKQIFFKKVI